MQLEDQEKGKIAKLQQNKEALQQEHKTLVDMHYKEVMEKDEEISRLKDQIEKLLAQVKKIKITKKELNNLTIKFPFNRFSLEYFFFHHVYLKLTLTSSTLHNTYL